MVNRQWDSLTLEKIVFDDTAEGSNAVAPADFLAVSVVAAVVGDTYFANPDPPHPADFCDNFRFDPEPILLNINLLNDVTAKDFVACLYVAEVEVSRDIGESGQNAVADEVPVIEIGRASCRERV